MVVITKLLQNLSEDPAVREADSEIKLLAELGDAFTEFLDADEEQQETWDETTASARVFGPGECVAAMELGTESRALVIILDSGKQFVIRCEQVK